MKYYYFVLIGNERNPVTVKIVVLVKISGKISLIFPDLTKTIVWITLIKNQSKSLFVVYRPKIVLL